MLEHTQDLQPGEFFQSSASGALRLWCGIVVCFLLWACGPIPKETPTCDCSSVDISWAASLAIRDLGEGPSEGFRAVSDLGPFPSYVSEEAILDLSHFESGHFVRDDFDRPAVQLCPAEGAKATIESELRSRTGMTVAVVANEELLASPLVQWDESPGTEDPGCLFIHGVSTVERVCQVICAVEHQ